MKKLLSLLLLIVTNSLCALDPVIILFGPPGSGKGTFSDFAAQYDYQHLSAGDLIRDEIKKQTPFGKEIEEIVKRGDNVDQDRLFLFVKEYMRKFQSENKPFIIDGFGRGEKDIGELCQFLKDQNLADKTIVLWLDAEDDACKERIKTRLVCTDCHYVFNSQIDPLLTSDICPNCLNAKVELRLNDNAEVTAKRIAKYREEYVHIFRRGTKDFASLSVHTNCERQKCWEFYKQLLEQLAAFDGTTSEFVAGFTTIEASQH